MTPPPRVIMFIRKAAFACLMASAFLGISSASTAATFEVASTSDLPDSNPGNGFCYATVGMFGICTLRAAVEEANALAGPDTILVPEGVYTLESTGGQLLLGEDVTIAGAGARFTVIETDGLHRIFDVDSGVIATITDLALRGATLDDGSGGAIIAWSASDLTLSRVWIDGNSSVDNCGGISTRGTITVTDSTFTNNVALTSSGSGGALCLSQGAQATVKNSTFHGNVASQGGAIYMVSGATSLTLLSSTLVDNRDTTPSVEPSATIYFGNGSLYIDKNLIRPDSCHYFDIASVSSNGGNAVGPGNGCVLGLPSDMTDLDWQGFALGSLGDYGGPVPTILPGTLSLVVDPGLSTATCPTFDARGEPRVDRCDVGAVERQLDDPESGPVFVDGFESGDTSAWQ